MLGPGLATRVAVAVCELRRLMLGMVAASVVFTSATLPPATHHAPGNRGSHPPVRARLVDPYSSRAAGFDLSFPNCSARPRHGRAFAVVGVGGGRPFTRNPCAAVEWRRSVRATGTRPSLYFNTADVTGRRASPHCQRAVGSAGVFGARRGHSLRSTRYAWEVGCSEGEYALSKDPGPPEMWWADVETANTWSPHPVTNRMILDGISYAMRTAGRGRPGGIYTASKMWASITGSRRWTPTPAVSAMWIAGGSCSTSLARTPTWLAQGGLVYGIDADSAC